jgi:hypothetical protein
VKLTETRFGIMTFRKSIKSIALVLNTRAVMVSVFMTFVMAPHEVIIAVNKTEIVANFMTI